jgi:hypothetical protein
MRQILIDHARRRRALKRDGESPVTGSALDNVGESGVAELPDAQEIDGRTVRRDWRKARTFILAELDLE